MIVLGIDTATEVVSVAVIDGDVVMAASELRSERRHAEDLTPMIDFVVKRAGLTFANLDAIAVDVGPGLFTGMRVGIASAQALAHVLSLPLVGIDGLAALAAAVPQVSAAQVDIIIPTIDARRREVAWAVYKVHEGATSTQVAAPRVGSLDDLVIAMRDRAQNCLLLGDFAARHRNDIEDALGPQSWTVSFGDDTLQWPHARHIALLAHHRLLHGDEHSDDQHSSAPTVVAMYLREADAEINWATRSHA
jgi:tRNA threonylcarbamoyladenosine biosynthesis protein TsaB